MKLSITLLVPTLTAAKAGTLSRRADLRRRLGNAKVAGYEPSSQVCLFGCRPEPLVPNAQYRTMILCLIIPTIYYTSCAHLVRQHR